METIKHISDENIHPALFLCPVQDCLRNAVIAPTAWTGLIILFFLILFPTLCFSQEYSDTQIVNAIQRAENSKSHPYGILAHYKHTTPRQACFNTVRHALKDWDGKGDFILFLQKRYCPIGASNDPTGLNANWYKNVMYFLREVK